MSEPLLSKAAELEFQKSCYGKCAAIKRSELRPLLDEKKLLASDLFYQALQYVILHSEKHRDYSRLGVLVDLFDVRDNQLFIAYWLSERLGLKCSMDKGRVRFKATGQPAKPDLRFKEGVSEFFKQGLKRAGKDTPNAEKKKPLPKRVDMLDSWARLPGSYGAGKRN
ncbi:hypothetical protein IPC1486_21660 [Pseudomonas aeruginosa]|uniref:hypothetical protein n=1 Tax=Pseudomonas aeruginosa TaxID=287 RepID=UPI001068B595|nr:hypothetical protein [Pseudomonas aeruginosa]MBG6730912.1 hypothetical protein [Pseudomonas aeruginosa]MBX5747709.1 hypothetical protein [Pseudomonas aeruginosa]MCT5436917.1 hypothetical protein [Pseudomonas aeruginosa]MCT5554621.1 hypothetical protein [Pseudomonas aeruginosa]MCT5581606.1 hypothetical protein [Pseudomonas aeruginosa]